MAEPTTTPYQPESETWASGVAQFGAVIMILVGAYQAATGLVALVGNELFLTTQNYVFQLDTTKWGWIHLVLGVVVVLAGCAVLARRTWGVVLGLVFCGLSAIANFAFIPHYPIWSMLIIALDVLVIWALLTYRAQEARR
jgi:hypothetical protein